MGYLKAADALEVRHGHPIVIDGGAIELADSEEDVLSGLVGNEHIGAVPRPLLLNGNPAWRIPQQRPLRVCWRDFEPLVVLIPLVAVRTFPVAVMRRPDHRLAADVALGSVLVHHFTSGGSGSGIQWVYADPECQLFVHEMHH